MNNKALYDPSFWYVVNTEYRHIVYRNKDCARAERHMMLKNEMMEKNGVPNMEYSVMSGQQLLAKQITSVGHLSKAG